MKSYLKLLPWQVVAFCTSYIPIYIIKNYVEDSHRISLAIIPLVIILYINVSYIFSKRAYIIYIIFLYSVILVGDYYKLIPAATDYISVYNSNKEDYKVFVKAYNETGMEGYWLNPEIDILNANKLYVEALESNVNIGLDILINIIDRYEISDRIGDNVFLYDFEADTELTEVNINKWVDNSSISMIKVYYTDISKGLFWVISLVILLVASLFLANIFTEYKSDIVEEDERKSRYNNLDQMK